MDKFGRNYELSVQTQNGKILTVGLPFTIEFDITRKTLASANVGQFRVYNLSMNHRNQLRFNASDFGTFRGLKLRAGYGNNLSTVFAGNLTQAWSVREGVNFITQLECFDGGFAFANGITSTPFVAGETQKGVITSLASSLPHVTLGTIGDYSTEPLTRGNSHNGKTTDILGELTGGGFFIDNGAANALGTYEYIAAQGNPIAVNASSGLLGTPVLEQTIVRFDMLFEPKLKAGFPATLTSLTEPSFNGLYKITGIKHRGMISAAVCGSAITTGEFLFGNLFAAK